MIQPKTLKLIVIRETRPYTGKQGELLPAIYREEAAPGWFGKVLFFIFYFKIYFNLRAAREFRRTSLSAGLLLHSSVLRTVREGLARAREPRPQAVQLSLCTPENLVSRDGSDRTLSVLY